MVVARRRRLAFRTCSAGSGGSGGSVNAPCCSAAGCPSTTPPACCAATSAPAAPSSAACTPAAAASAAAAGDCNHSRAALGRRCRRHSPGELNTNCQDWSSESPSSSASSGWYLHPTAQPAATAAGVGFTKRKRAGIDIQQASAAVGHRDCLRHPRPTNQPEQAPEAVCVLSCQAQVGAQVDLPGRAMEQQCRVGSRTGTQDAGRSRQQAWHNVVPRSLHPPPPHLLHCSSVPAPIPPRAAVWLSGAAGARIRAGRQV